MCDNSNIFNLPNDTVYECSNIGSGQGVYAGGTPEFEFKSISAGSNVSITSDASTITISSTDTGVTSVTNLGAGSAVGVDVLGSALRLRTLVGQRGMGVNQLGNTVTFDCNLVTSKQNTLYYKYLKDQNPVSLSTSYNSPLGAISNSGDSNSGYLSTVNNVSLDQVVFNPGPRMKENMIWPFTTTDTAGNENCSLLNLVPDLSYYSNAREDYLVGSNTSSGELYLINMNNLTEERFAYYDVDAVAISGAYAVAIDVNDALIFYSQSYNIFVHDYVTKTDIFSFNANDFQLWPVGAEVACLYYDQEKNVLSVMSNIATNRIWSFSIPPFDRYNNNQLNIGFGALGVSPIPIPVGSTPDQFIVNYYQQVFGTVITATTTTIGMYNSIGSGSNALNVTSSIETQTLGYALCDAASGRIYLISRDTKDVYRSDFASASVATGFTLIGALSQTYNGLTRCVYGPRQSI